jgi:SAM-dependent methyltransferase
MAEMETASVDSIVCDPPYELGFMGKSWDASGIAYDLEVWRQALRVLKPGGYLLAFSATRTYHRMTCAIEDAGFEIRDGIGWHYGSGFPKSLDVSKAIDKIDRAEASEARARTFTAWMRSTGITAQQVNDATGTCMGSHYLTDKSQPSVATADLFDLLRPLLPPVPDEIEELVRSRTVESENMKRRAIVGKHQSTSPGCNMRTGMLGGEKDAVSAVTEPYTDDARCWSGWGTALKPAWEPVVVARKPLEGTVAANVLKHGTGAMNIDGCRVPTSDKLGGGHSSSGQQMSDGWRRPWMDDPEAVEANAARSRAAVEKAEALGRWPANLLLSHATDCGEECAPGCPCAAMDAQSGGDGASRFFSNLPIEADDLVPFFYAAKASRREREAGCDDLPARSGAEAVEREEGSAGVNSPRAGAGRTAGSVRNNHPTVKPVSVMAWCIRLVTPPGGLVLDPFTGSGTTGVAARREGMRFVGCELSEEYAEIARARIAHASGPLFNGGE